MTCSRDQIAVSLQELVHAVLEREEFLMSLCRQGKDSDYRETMAAVVRSQRHVEESLAAFRSLMGNRFADYLDSEVILSCLLLSSIWHNARALCIRSCRLGDVIGRHQPEKLAELALRLASGKSPMLSFLRLKWDEMAEPAGQYGFIIHSPSALIRLVFGETE